MTPIRSVTRLLDDSKVRYKCYTHQPTFSAQETAEALHISGYEQAKAVLLRVDGRLMMVVLAACERVDFKRIKQQTGALSVELASEDDMERLVAPCERGCLPPLGNLYSLKVIVSPTLTRDEQISFSAGTHTEDIRMSYDDWEALVQPKVLPIAC